MPILGDRAARSGSRARPAADRLAEAGFNNPTINHVDADGASDGRPPAPAEAPWTCPRIGASCGSATASRIGGRTGAIVQALPRVHRHDARRRRRPHRTRRDGPQEQVGRDRKYVVAFLSGGSPQQPLVEFVAADDYEQTRELVAVIRGSDGGRRMYGVGDALPAVYTERFRTQIYNERVVHPGAWNKIVVVAREDDDEAILNHALIQSRRRYRS